MSKTTEELLGPELSPNPVKPLSVRFAGPHSELPPATLTLLRSGLFFKDRQSPVYREILIVRSDIPKSNAPSNEIRQEVAEGLFYTHSRLSQNTNKLLEASSFLYSLVELLNERGLITIDELDERKKVVGQRLAAQLKEQGLGVLLQEQEEDKYNFKGEAKIDCENRVQFCHAACCRLPFALSKQDVYEGVVRWDLGRPYLIAQGKHGYCTHFDQGTSCCTVREQRPVPCRGYDCRNDKRIWLDFENRIVNPDIDRADWPHCEAESLAQENRKVP